MLKTDAVAAPVAIAELEEIAAGERPHRVFRRQRDAANDVRFGSQRRRARRQRAPVRTVARTPALSTSPSCRASRPDPAYGSARPRSQIDDPDLMRPRHRDEEQASVERQIPRRAERRSRAPAPPCPPHDACRPVPAIVVTPTRVESTARTAWLSVSAT
jgi:hypothetical protein